MLAAIDKMHVSVIEPRQQQLALRIDDPGLWSVPGIDFSGAAHGHNAIAQHGQRFCFRTSFIDSPDSRVSNNQISSRFALGRNTDRQKRRKNEDECGNWKCSYIRGG